MLVLHIGMVKVGVGGVNIQKGLSSGFDESVRLNESDILPLFNAFGHFKGNFLHMKGVWNEGEFQPNFRELISLHFTHLHLKRAWINEQHPLSFFI